MANLSKVKEVFDTYLNDNWSLTQKFWENINFDIPNETYIVQSLTIDYSQNVTIGDNRTRHSGVYMIRVFAPLNTSSVDAISKADALIKLFQNKNLFDNILTYAGSIRIIGDGGYGLYQINVLIPFTADQQSID